MAVENKSATINKTLPQSLQSTGESIWIHKDDSEPDSPIRRTLKTYLPADIS